MIFRKVTRKIVFSTVAMLAVGFLNMSCSNEEFEEQGMRMTLATRSASEGGEILTIRIPQNGNHTFHFNGKDSLISCSYNVSWGSGMLYPYIESSAKLQTSQPQWNCINFQGYDENDIETNVQIVEKDGPRWGSYTSSEESIPITMTLLCFVSMTHKPTNETVTDTITSGDFNDRVHTKKSVIRPMVYI